MATAHPRPRRPRSSRSTPLRAAPALDATGLVNLESAVERLRKAGVFEALAGLQPQPFRARVRAGWRIRPGEIVLRRSFERGIEAVRQALAPPSPQRSS